MPYKVFKRGEKWKVYKVDDNDKPVGEALGTHDSQEQAAAQIRAVQANEKKEQGDKTKMGDAEMEPMPWYPACSFAELEAMEAAGKMHKMAMSMTDKFKMMADNIMYNGEIEDKGAALAALAKEYAGKMGEMKKPGAVRKALDAIGITTPEPQPEAASLFIWKSGDTYRWIAAYSNNRRDDDDPPEIISSESHKEFDRALETKEWPMPEVWLWHVPYPVGITQYHAYDESAGFPVAAGVFYKGMDWAAEGLVKSGWNGVSHGMPTVEIRRDETDPTVITRHRTKEISFLPAWAAANKLAFNIITKETMMEEQKGLPAQKRGEFEKVFGAERVAEIEMALGEKAKEADAAGIEKKEAVKTVAEAPEVKQPETPEEAAPPETPALRQAQDAALTREEVAEALGAVIEPVKALTDLVKELQTEVAALKSGQEQAVKEQAETTPAFSSLLSMLQTQRAVGAPETQVDGRKTLAKDGPEEADEQPQFIWQAIQKANDRQRAA